MSTKVLIRHTCIANAAASTISSVTSNLFNWFSLLLFRYFSRSNCRKMCISSNVYPFYVLFFFSQFLIEKLSIRMTRFSIFHVALHKMMCGKNEKHVKQQHALFTHRYKVCFLRNEIYAMESNWTVRHLFQIILTIIYYRVERSREIA